MKLIKCYVENFGCLHQFTYQFEEELTTINEMNGWGKSTFAVFVRSMFYGMPKNTKRNLDENERKKYTPWNGGTMGGNLVFEVHGKTYKMERFFDIAEKDDIFTLYDYQTNLVSTDYSSNIGEEMFGIDLDAYAKSAYISQDAIEIGTNDSINAKLGNLLDSDNDINNFDTAIKNLKEAKKKYKMQGRKGSIPEAELEITKKNVKLEKKESIREALAERTKQMKQIKMEKEKINKELEEVKEKVGKAAKYESYEQKKKQYDEIVLAVADKKQEIVKTKEFFKTGIPSEKAVMGCSQAITTLEQLKGEQKSYLLTDQENKQIKLFEERIAEGVFSNETLDSMEKKNRKYNEIAIKIEDGKLSATQEQEKEEGDKFFQKGIPTDEELFTFSSYITEIHRQETEIAKMEAVDKIEVTKSMESKKKSFPILIVFAIVFFCAGTMLYIFEKDPYAIAAIGIGFICMGIQTIWKSKSTKQTKQEDEQNAKIEEERTKEIECWIQKKEELKNKIESFLQRFAIIGYSDSYLEPLMQIRDRKTKYIALLEKIKKVDVQELEEDKEEQAKSLETFLKAMEEETCANDLDWEKGLQNIRERYNQFLVLRKRREQAAENKVKIKDYEERIQKFLQGFQGEADEDYFGSLDRIKSKVEEWNRLNLEEKKVLETKTRMEEASDFKEWVELKGEMLAIETIRTEETKLEEKRENQNELEKKIQDSMNELLDKADELNEIEQEKIILEEQLEKDIKKFEVIEGTIKYLEEAKELFSTHYLKGLRKSFETYMERVGDKNISGAKIDAKMEVSIDKNGAMRKLDYFSRGNKDLINVCARFALVDALFEEEKPVLILDDTFVNFDGEKLEKVLELLEEISKVYQVIYLVCHESRVNK